MYLTITSILATPRQPSTPNATLAFASLLVNETIAERLAMRELATLRATWADRAVVRGGR